MKPLLQLRFPKRLCSGVTLVEVLVAGTLLCMIAAGLFALDSTCRTLCKAQRETATASQVLEEVMDDLRGGNWSQATTSSGIQGLLGGLTTDVVGQLALNQMKVTVTPYPALTPAPTPLVVTRATDGTCTLVSQPASGFSLRSVLAVRVDVQLKWRGAGRTTDRVREISTVISLSGLLR